MSEYIFGTNIPNIFVCNMRKRSNLDLASKKEQTVRVEKMKKCDCLINVRGFR